MSARITTGVTYACVFFALAVALIGALGVIGVRTATQAGNELAGDELSTATITAQLTHAVDAAFTSGQVLALTSDQARRGRIATTLYDDQIPAVEADLASLQRIHESDDAAELAGIKQVFGQWATLRALLNTAASQGDAGPALGAELETAYTPLSTHLGTLTDREAVDAIDDQAVASSRGGHTTWAIALAVLAAALASCVVGWAASRRLRRAIEPAQDQVEFADTLQLAEDEDEAHHLLQRHLQRLVTGARVTVLNRNNSADRLEAVTALPAGSTLVQTLNQAEPRSCLAVRSARVHNEDDQVQSLLSCSVCGPCPGKSTCSPLTVGGQVIGSVLVNRATGYSADEQVQIRDSVGQAAPVLANLRNLAIAELRAATDSLTGLPNKRAVGDTLKRMVAQASRTLAPLSLLMLDLDHFKDLNDRFGHPVGDQALANVGAALRSVIRDSDFAGRNGGEEFVILLPETDVDGATLTAEKIRAAIADIQLPGVDVTVTASVGIATYPTQALSAERLERLADSALYTAKRSGRDRIEVATPQESAESAVDPAADQPAPSNA